MTDEAIFEEVIVVPRKAFPSLPDLRVIERPGWVQIVTPSIKTGGLNEVAFSALDEEDADRVIDATIAEYRALGVKFRWNAGPGSAPADLGARLERRGLVASWGRGMASSTTDLPGEADRAIAIDEIDEANVGEFSRVMAEGWGLELAPVATVNRLIAASAAARQRMFLARWDDEPAAIASYVAFPRSAYLLGGVALPRFRGRGLYRALVQARLADARAHGIALATSHAREATSAPILERLGFTTICRFPMYFG
jgi:GNAT superfamily N-acetyltransferase